MKMVIHDIKERNYGLHCYSVDLSIDGIQYKATFSPSCEGDDEERFYCWKKSTERYLRAPTKLSMVRSFVRDTIRELEA